MSNVVVTESKPGVVVEVSNPFAVVQVGDEFQDDSFQTKSFGSLYEKPLPTKCPKTKCDVVLSINAFDGYTAGPVYTVPQLKTADMIESNYDATDVVTVTAGLGTSYLINTVTSPDAALGYIPHDIEFVLEGSYVAIGIHHYVQYENYHVWIDDEEIATWQTGSVDQAKSSIDINTGTCITVVNLKFAARGTYRIRIAGAFYLSSLAINNNASIHRPRKRPRLYVFSDSYYSAMQPFSTTQAEWIRTRTGFTVINGAIAGTGWINTFPYSHPSRLARLALEDESNLIGILVNGSGNDLSNSVASIQAAQDTFFNAVRAITPTTPVVCVGIEDVAAFVTANPGLDIPAVDTALLGHALADVNVVGTISPVSEDWLTGTGNTGATTGTGNQDFLIQPDGSHASAAGLEYHARLTVERMFSMPAQLGALR